MVIPERTQHARGSRLRMVPIALAGLIAIGALVVSVSTAAANNAEAEQAAAMAERPPLPQAALSIPVPVDGAVPLAPTVCEQPAVIQALAGGTDADVVAAVGGGARFRDVVATGQAPCIELDDATRTWVVVNKARPFADERYAPTDLASPAIQSLNAHQLRAAAQGALDAFAAASVDAGAGRIALLSGYRSYDVQVIVHDRQVASEGQAQADATSARPGYSEHQTGFAADVVACGAGCGGMDQFGSTPQGAFARDHGWEFGFIVRYEPGLEGTTGYTSEPWHLRYVGVELATAYHEGGFRTLEEFFGLPAAPDYLP